jgi:hypothetical protein
VLVVCVIKDLISIRSLIDCGMASDVETVSLDGKVVMEERQIPGAPPIGQLLARAQAFAEAYWSAFAQLDWPGRTADEAFPSAFPWAE